MSEVCSICLENDFKYTCPACNTKTCSVSCVKRHKLRSECTGEVDPTKFIPNKDLGAKPSLVNRDYNYLLNFERKVELGKSDIKNSAKNVFKRAFGQGQGQKRHKTSSPDDARLEKVHRVFPNEPTTSIKRQNTMIVHLPPGMSRATQNKSGYDKKASAFTWTIEWVPVDATGKLLKSFISFRLKESLVLADAIPMTVLGNTLGAATDKDALCFYLDNCLNGSSSRQVLALDAKSTLASALANKVVLEFPKIYVGVGATMDQSLTTEFQAYGLKGEAETSSDSDSSEDTTLSGESESDSLSEESDSDSGPEEASSKQVLPEETKEAREEVALSSILQDDEKNTGKSVEPATETASKV